MQSSQNIINMIFKCFRYRHFSKYNDGSALNKLKYVDHIIKYNKYVLQNIDWNYTQCTSNTFDIILSLYGQEPIKHIINLGIDLATNLNYNHAIYYGYLDIIKLFHIQLHQPKFNAYKNNVDYNFKKDTFTLNSNVEINVFKKRYSDDKPSISNKNINERYHYDYAPFMNIAAKHNKYEIMLFLFNNNIRKCNSIIIQYIIEHNNIDMLRFIVACYPQLTYVHYLENAIKNNYSQYYFDIIKLLSKHNNKNITYTIELAIKNKRYDILSYLCEHCNGKYIDDVAYIVTLYGHLPSLQTMTLTKKQHEYLYNIAIENGHVNIIEWFDKQLCKYTHPSIELGAIKGHIDMLTWFHVNKKITVSTDVIDNAATFGNTDVILYIINNKIGKFTKRAIENAMKNDHTLIASFLTTLWYGLETPILLKSNKPIEHKIIDLKPEPEPEPKPKPKPEPVKYSYNDDDYDSDDDYFDHEIYEEEEKSVTSIDQKLRMLEKQAQSLSERFKQFDGL
jgi:hypothetical protein